MAARKLTAKERRELPARAFGIPSSHKYPVMILGRDGKPKFSKGHAVEAKSRAKQELEKGRIDRRQYNQIVRKADAAIRSIDRAKKKKAPAKRKVAKKKAAKRSPRKNSAETIDIGPADIDVDFLAFHVSSHPLKRNAAKRRKNPIGHTENDLELTIVNDGVLYEGVRAPLEVQLAKKMAQGKYSRSAAVKGWRRFVDAGARKYAKDGGFSSRERFPSAMRDSVAERLATEWEDQYGIEGNPGKATKRRKNPSASEHERIGLKALRNSEEYWRGYVADKSKTNLLVDAYKFLVIAHEELKYSDDPEPRLQADRILKLAHKELSKQLK